jgi:hypothetical protein
MIDLTVVVKGAEPMGLLDRVKAAFGGGDEEDDAQHEAHEPPLDVDARRAQLDELEAAIAELTRAMTADAERMRNPGWRGRVEDLRFGAAEAARLIRRGFDRAALLDLAAEVRPLYGSGPVPAEYVPYQAAHERVVAAAAAIRAPLPSESGPR